MHQPPAIILLYCYLFQWRIRNFVAVYFTLCFITNDDYRVKLLQILFSELYFRNISLWHHLKHYIHHLNCILRVGVILGMSKIEDCQFGMQFRNSIDIPKFTSQLNLSWCLPSTRTSGKIDNVILQLLH